MEDSKPTASKFIESDEETQEKNSFQNRFKGWKKSLSDKKNEDLKNESLSAHEWAENRKYTRPFKALTEMPENRLHNLLERLEIYDLEDARMRDSRLIAKAVLDTPRKGLAGRLHTRSEQLKPGFNLSWRQMLMRILDEHLKVHFPADIEDQDIEVMVLQAYDKNNKYVERKTNKPAIPGKISAKGMAFDRANLFIDLAGSLDNFYETLLSTEDKHAIDTILSIIKWIHVASPDAELKAEPI